MGHFGSILRGMIFSFHMPLFFIVSGLTMSVSRGLDVFLAKVKKGVKHLIVPAIVTYMIVIAWIFINNWNLLSDIVFWRNRLYALVFASGVEGDINGRHIAAMGAQWFFFVMFIGKIIFDYNDVSALSI